MNTAQRFTLIRILAQVQGLIAKAIENLTRGVKPQPDPVFIRWHPTQQSYFEAIMARITNEQRVRISVNPKTAAGRPARIDGAVNFTSLDESVGSIEVIDATSAYVNPVGLGATQIKATFDADMGEGVREITASGSLEVVEAEAETGEIVFGTPELTPTADPG